MLRFRVAASSREDSMRVPTATASSYANNSLNSSNTSAKTTASNLSNILISNNRIYSKTLANAGINNIGFIGNSSNITNSFYPRTVLIAKNYRQQREKTVVPQTLATFPLAINNKDVSANNNSSQNKFVPPVSSVSSSSRSTTPKVMSRATAGRMSSLETARTNNRPSTIDCSCIFCLNKLLLDKKQQKKFLKNSNVSIVDTKSFLDSLKNLKTSIKLESYDDEPNAYGTMLDTSVEPIVINSPVIARIKTSNSSSASQTTTTRLLSKTSRIKLWKPNEINEFTNENRVPKSGKTLNRSEISNYRRAVSTSFKNRQNILTTPDISRDNLSRVFQDLNLNPNLSPLLVHTKDKNLANERTFNNHDESDAEQLWTLTNSDDFDDRYPRNPPTTPNNPIKVIITSKEKP